MRKITVKVEAYFDTGRQGGGVREILEIEIEESDTPEEQDEEIENNVKEWMFNHIDWGFERLK